jgi:hypothetical protein
MGDKFFKFLAWFLSRRREAIGLGENSKTETETNWKCAQNDYELKPELQITTHHSMQQDTKLHTEFHVAERFEDFQV